MEKSRLTVLIEPLQEAQLFSCFCRDLASFPSPQQVAEMDLATLRTAGLSLRKAEYGKCLPFVRSP
jgi:3-methyladenine DNA glycosylase/8-oxoguanine DNA glycosylase